MIVYVVVDEVIDIFKAVIFCSNLGSGERVILGEGLNKILVFKVEEVGIFKRVKEGEKDGRGERVVSFDY